MDVKHLHGIVKRKNVFRVINEGEMLIFKLHTESPGEVFIQQLT